MTEQKEWEPKRRYWSISDFGLPQWEWKTDKEIAELDRQKEEHEHDLFYSEHRAIVRTCKKCGMIQIAYMPAKELKVE